ncbi:ATP-binding cassette domain-containing protein, partial [Candidatus Pacearchaeota archaeon]|nr:ATP-binding cassette domain-containing protein [Candidatus Pacearchaeota archaeon]
EVTFDGVSLENIKQSSISKRISIVLQDSEMFNMSLEDNVMISGEENSKHLSWAAKVANLKPVIKNLPKGLKTIIGEKGYKLSGGERQRVGIARAVYRNSDILILDEATSHLDSKTEKIIQENLERELHGKTMIIIAHRLSTLKNVDRIIVMDEGKIVEEGKFDELIKKRGLFSQIYKIQQHQKKGYL